MTNDNKKTFQNYKELVLPKVCEHCFNLEVRVVLTKEVNVCSLGEFQVSPVGTCDYYNKSSY